MGLDRKSHQDCLGKTPNFVHIQEQTASNVYNECYNSALDAAAAIGRDFKVSHWIRFGGRIHLMRHAYSTAIQNLLIIVKCICPLWILQHCGFNLQLETIASPLI